MKITRMRLAILSFLVVLTQRSSGQSQTTIDWNKCDTPSGGGANAETECYVKYQCMFPTAQIKMKKLEDVTELAIVPGVCDTGIQIKPYNDKKWLVYLQVSKEADGQLDTAEGVWIEEGGGKKLIGCKKTNTGIEYFGDFDLSMDKYPKAVEKIEGDQIFCAILITARDTFDNILHEGSRDGAFKYKTNAQISRVMPILKHIASGMKSKIRCNPDRAVYDSSYNSPDLFTNEIQITEQSKNVCPSGNLFVKDKEYVEVADIECVSNGNLKYNFQYKLKEPPETSVDIKQDKIFNVLCGFKACAKCDESELEPSGAPAEVEKPKFTAGDPATGKCALAKCGTASDAWENNWEYETEDGKREISVSTVECKKHNGNATWMMKKGNGEVPVKKAWCSKKIDCKSKNPLKYECPSFLRPEVKDGKEVKGSSICVNPNKTASDFGCGPDKLNAWFPGFGTVLIKNLTCEHATGIWRGTKDNSNLNQTYIYCTVPIVDKNPSTGGQALLISVCSGLAVILVIIIGVGITCFVRRHRKYTESEVEQRVRPRRKSCCWNWFYDWFLYEKLCTDDLSQVKEWPDNFFETVLKQWMKFSVYERKKFSERIGFELGVASTCEQFFKLFSRIFEVETDYRIWQGVVPVFKLLHAQASDKENNMDTDKRMRKWCVSKCTPIIDKLGWDGCNNEWRDTAYQRYQIMNLLYYCDDKDFIEKLLEFFDKGQFHGLHSINRQVAWAAAVREKDQFEAAKAVAQTAFVDKAVVKALAAKRDKSLQPPSSGKTKTKTMSDAASGNSSKSNKDKKAGSKEAGKGGSKESKSTASKDGSKSGKSNRSNKSNKSKKDKKGSKETPSGKAKKGDSKESSKSSKKEGKDKKGGSKKEGKGREKAGAEDSGNEKKGTASDKDKKTKSGKDKKTASGKDKKDKSGKSGKDKKTKSEKDKKEGKSAKEKTALSSKESKSGKSNKSKKDKKGDKSGKSSKEKTKSSKEKTEKTAVDKTAGSVKSKKSTKSVKNSKKPTKPGVKERKDADGDKLHGDRAQHIFFAIGSSRSKEQIASFLDYYIDYEEFDASNLVYLFAATLEWDDTRSYGLDLFLNMNKKVFMKMPPGDKYHMRILKNFRRYDHIVNDPNYTAKHYSAIELSLMLKRIQNNVTFQPKMIDQLDEALKKLNF